MVDNVEEFANLLRKRGVKVEDEGFAISFEIDGREFSAIPTGEGVMVAGIMSADEVVRGLLGQEAMCDGGDGDE